MSSELIPLAEAAAQLGVSVEELLEMRTKKQIFGIRDGSSWKFKKSELKRVKEDLGLGSGVISDLDTPVENASDSMVLLGGMGDRLLSDGGSALKVGGSLPDPDEVSLEDVKQGGSKRKPKSDETANAADEENSENMDLLDDELFGSDELTLKGSAGLEDSGEMSSDFVDDSDIIVNDSDSSGSDHDSLLLDDEDLVVSNKGVDDDDFELSDSSILTLDDGGGGDDFDLAPVTESLDDQSSSSQVIALEDSGFLDDANPTMMGGSIGDLLSADDFGDSGAMPLESFGDSGLPAGQGEMVGGPAMVPAEAPYTAMQVLSLASTFLILGLLSMLSMDLAQNMWQPVDTGVTHNVANFLVDKMQFDL